MKPLYYLISAVLLGWHQVCRAASSVRTSGAAWALSIIGLTLVIRAALIPLFVKQIKSSRNMQLLQPRVKELQKKYGHDRERLAQETMALYQETKTNPFSSCLPLIIQMPIFLGAVPAARPGGQERRGPRAADRRRRRSSSRDADALRRARSPHLHRRRRRHRRA